MRNINNIISFSSFKGRKEFITYRIAILLSLGLSITLFLFFSLNLYFNELISPNDDFAKPPHRVTTITMLYNWISTFLLILCLFLLNFRLFKTKISPPKRNLIIVIGSLLIILIFRILTTWILTEIDSPLLDSPIFPIRWRGTFRDIFLMVIIIFISQILLLSQKRRYAELNYEAMKAENANSRFEALKNQLDPHFLFNTFNTLDSLIQEDPEGARNYLQQLSAVFRYVMPNKDLTTLEDELEFTRNYNDLMQLRYEDCLIFEFDIDENFLHYQIVPLSIQTLVENAIKHNVISAETPFTINISVGPEPIVTVTNLIKPKKTSQNGSGIGLSNLSERFKLKLQKEVIITNVNGVFKVTLPLLTPENNKHNNKL